MIASKARLVCDAEVFQEILHRYAATNKHDKIAPAFQLLGKVLDEVFPIEQKDVMRAASIGMRRQDQGSRDAIHIAVMERYGITSIFSFDKDYDRWPGLKRIHQPPSGL